MPRLNMHAFSAWSMGGLAIAGVAPLAVFAWMNKLGDFAKSPQEVEMNLGTTTFVAGGRAKLWFASVDMGPQVEVSCKGTSRLIDLTDEPSEEVCGIQVRQIDLRTVRRGRFDVMRGRFEVTWKSTK